MPQATVIDLPTSSPRGAKQTCTNEACGRRFYDLNQATPACPYCLTTCNVEAVDRHEFTMAVRTKKGKVYRLEAISAPLPPDVLIDVEDDDEDASDEVVDHEKQDEGAS